MSVIMTLQMHGDPDRLEAFAAENEAVARGIADKAKEHGLIAHRFYGTDDGRQARDARRGGLGRPVASIADAPRSGPRTAERNAFVSFSACLPPWEILLGRHARPRRWASRSCRRDSTACLTSSSRTLTGRTSAVQSSSGCAESSCAGAD